MAYAGVEIVGIHSPYPLSSLLEVLEQPLSINVLDFIVTVGQSIGPTSARKSDVLSGMLLYLIEQSSAESVAATIAESDSATTALISTVFYVPPPTAGRTIPHSALKMRALYDSLRHLREDLFLLQEEIESAEEPTTEPTS